MNTLPLALLCMPQLAPGPAPTQEERVGAALAAAIEGAGSAGPALTVAIGPAGAIRSRGVGSLDAEGARTASGTTGVHSPGVAELVTQILVCDLVARGELDLHAPIASLAPGLSDVDRPVLLSTALAGRSGLRDVRDVLYVRQKGERGPADIAVAARWISRGVRRHGRTTVSDTALLAAVLEHVAERPLAELARERLFRPLAMDSTDFRPGPAPGHARGFVSNPERGLAPALPHGRIHAIEGLYTTAPDLCLLGHEVVAPRVLHPDALKTLIAATESGRAGRTSMGWTPAYRRTVEWVGRTEDAALTTALDAGWSVACLDARAPGRAREGVWAVRYHIDGILDPLRAPGSLLGIGGGAGGRYGGRRGPIHVYETDELAGHFQVVELDLELTVSATARGGFRLKLEGWPPLISTRSLVSGFGSVSEAEGVEFRSEDGTLSARLEVLVRNRSLIPTALTLEGDFQRHGSLDGLRIQRSTPRER
ncbi:MAG: serine hydrolase domain-containing protein [Planctomycetota bacterium]